MELSKIIDRARALGNFWLPLVPRFVGKDKERLIGVVVFALAVVAIPFAVGTILIGLAFAAYFKGFLVKGMPGDSG